MDMETVLLLCSLDESNMQEIQVLPFGRVDSKNGTFEVNAASMESMVQAFAAEKNDLVVDYEHQTLKGTQAPAAGWIKALINKGKDGLWARVEWTDKAADMIRSKEYRYLSPVVLLRNKKAVVLHSAGLTNTPAIDGMAPLANKNGNGEDTGMEELLKKLAKILGLEESANAADVTAAVEKCMNQPKPVANKEVLELLGLKEDADMDAVRGCIQSMQEPVGYVKADEFKALKEKLETRERDDLVAMALKSGKVAPASKAWAEDYALKDPAGFQAFLKDAPVVVPFKEAAGGQEISPVDTPDDMQLSINKKLGISDEVYQKFNKSE